MQSVIADCRDLIVGTFLEMFPPYYLTGHGLMTLEMRWGPARSFLAGAEKRSVSAYEAISRRILVFRMTPAPPVRGLNELMANVGVPLKRRAWSEVFRPLIDARLNELLAFGPKRFATLSMVYDERADVERVAVLKLREKWMALLDNPRVIPSEIRRWSGEHLPAGSPDPVPHSRTLDLCRARRAGRAGIRGVAAPQSTCEVT